ncbi:MAG: radical SAM protein [Verrucomicrobiia bacterium]
MIVYAYEEEWLSTPESFAQRWNERPFLVIWEVTRRCALACRHCRAAAHSRWDRSELSTEAGRRFLEQVAELGPKVMVLTGGDPFARGDLLELVRFGVKECGLNLALSPSATPEFLEAPLMAFAEAGVRRVSFSLDGAEEATHDAFRGVAGTWRRTMTAVAKARGAGLEVQINTTLGAMNVHEFEGLERVVEEIRPAMWNVFFLVPTGRGRREVGLGAEETERILERLAAVEQEAPFAVKTTEAPQFRRVALQRWRKIGGRRPPRSLGVGDGRGCVFVSHRGEVFPSGFLPVPCGNIQERSVGKIYRQHYVFRQLRDADQLKGKCGRCEYRWMCGGSRARAFAVKGDYLASEPSCPYQPGGVDGC